MLLGNNYYTITSEKKVDIPNIIDFITESLKMPHRYVLNKLVFFGKWLNVG